MERNIRRSDTIAKLVGTDFDTTVAPDGDARVSGPEVDADAGAGFGVGSTPTDTKESASDEGGSDGVGFSDVATASTLK